MCLITAPYLCPQLLLLLYSYSSPSSNCPSLHNNLITHTKFYLGIYYHHGTLFFFPSNCQYHTQSTLIYFMGRNQIAHPYMIQLPPYFAIVFSISIWHFYEILENFKGGLVKATGCTWSLRWFQTKRGCKKLDVILFSGYLFYFYTIK